ncbi:four-carbon acid sugar kinase family protein [Mucilaginibacter pocheonensis]|uniref:Uncharacterized protein YgbK (DUF1537 family) n=1 Tax=Mucilaginibacter pocheonensis TaxID=398050 RepID=A0ABU1TG72_9SPHI|nr:four-carbon acid sugar kinase family protein [Mucilaginibacter pocheonensis]MDR6944412.1 uncharacterized protein YgbK (DUF1537 family) [Mucilaginibacter pocheonensis]
MIAVIADDLTGAAELAGIGLDYQLKTEINTIVDPACTADLLIIATDTRSLRKSEAKSIISNLTRQLVALKPQIIFKKIDSALRGHVLDEIESQMEAAHLKRALIVPGNPQHGKKVINGIYYYNGKPVHLSNYAHDPAFPVISSNVRVMLRANETLPILKTDERLPETGIVIGEAPDPHDLVYWAELADNKTLIAGASGLFNSLLALFYEKHVVSAKAPGALLPRLFVFGSTFNQGKYPVIDGLIHNIPVVHIPARVIVNDVKAHLYENYLDLIIQYLTDHRNAIIAISSDTLREQPIDPVQLAGKMGNIIKYINQQVHLNELLIEGGATAWAILAQLNITKLHPLQQISAGVIRTNVAGDNQLYVTLKPGSYKWPASVWATN